MIRFMKGKTLLTMRLKASADYDNNIVDGTYSDKKSASIAMLPMWAYVDVATRKVTFSLMTSRLVIDLKNIPADCGKAKLVVTSKTHKLNGLFTTDITQQTKKTDPLTTIPEFTIADKESDGTDNILSFCFDTEGSEIAERVFCFPIPTGTYEAGDLSITLVKEDASEISIEADWTASTAVFSRARGKLVRFTI